MALSEATGFRANLIKLPRWVKRLLLIGNDFTLLAMSLWAALSLRLSTLYIPDTLELALILLGAPVIGVLTFNYFGLYRLVTRYIGHKGSVRIYIAISVAVLIWTLVVYLSGYALVGVPRSVVLIYWALSVFSIWVSRQFAGWVLKSIPYSIPKHIDGATNVMIYGAGDAGAQLAQTLVRSRDHTLIGFMDDSPSLWNQKLSGIKVYNPELLGDIIQRRGVAEVLMAMPEKSKEHRRDVLGKLEPYPVTVKILPSMADIASGRVTVNDLRPVEGEDLLGRDLVPPVEDLLRRDVEGKSVLVTGAGGSIGSELTRQLLAQKPRKLVLFELSEAALYVIEAELQERLAVSMPLEKVEGEAIPELSSQTELVSVLGSVLDRRLIRDVIAEHEIETIYHAAAYKHVPIVEQNPIVGVKNNTLGTLQIALAARDLEVDRFVLVSTDKAVRPTNVMGASKRLSELILQSLAAENEGRTVFTMVRFGNVLDSSGSVVRRFRKQIMEGGPVTVTHPKVERYFMSISEAAQLVIQAGAMGRGGDVFVLEMGKPVKIDDLARMMIGLMGREVRDLDKQRGDIAIVYTGLRPGEKLSEELLIGHNTTNTRHPRIMRNHEPFIPLDQLTAELNKLRDALEDGDTREINAILKRNVEQYTSSSDQSGLAEDEDSETISDWPPTQLRALH